MILPHFQMFHDLQSKEVIVNAVDSMNERLNHIINPLLLINVYTFFFNCENYILSCINGLINGE